MDFIVNDIKIVLKTGTIIVDGLRKNVYNYGIDWDIQNFPNGFYGKDLNSVYSYMDRNILNILME